MKSARVADFHTILIGLLTQYDQRASAYERKRYGKENIYRLGHLLTAADKVETKAKSFGIWERDDANAIAAYHNFLTQHFIYEQPRRAASAEFALSPLRQLEKKMKAWVDHGRLPTYGKLRSNPWEAVFE